MILKRSLLCCILFSNVLACHSVNIAKPETEDTLNPFSAVVKFYRGPLNHLSAVRIGECPMYPSDSEYSLQSVKKHGLIMGWIMSLDRLMRCGRDETRLSPRVLVNGKWKTFDPVGKNDFWWNHNVANDTNSAATARE